MRYLLILLTLTVALRGMAQNTSYEKADSIAARYADYPLDDLRQLSQLLTHSLTSDREKFRAIYRWVCDNIANDYSLYAENKYKRKKWRHNPEALEKWDKTFAPKVIKRLVKKRSTICTGYAYLIKELAYHSDIACEIVSGYGRTPFVNVGKEGIPNHSWNAVQLDGNWYLCDATWSSGTINAAYKTFSKQYSDAYFLAPPEIFVRNHYPLDTAWILMDKKPGLDEFLNGPLVYKGTFNQHFLPQTPGQLEFSVKRKQTQQFYFKILDERANIQQVNIGMIRFGSVQNYKKEVSCDQDGNCSFTHAFRFRGRFELNIILENDKVLKYKVVVK